MHYFKFDIKAYLSHTAHLDDLEDLAYRRMMDWSYLHEEPLPKDISKISKLIRMRTESERIANILQEFWIEEEEGYFNAKINDDIGIYRSKSANAKAAAEKRWSKKTLKKKQIGSKTKDNANALQTDSEGNANKESIISNKESIISEKFSDEDMKVAIYIFKRIRVLNPKQKKPNFDVWANDVRLMVKQDKRTRKEICELFKWANEDSFWKSNILSPAKLRDKFDDLSIRMANPVMPTTKPEWQKIPFDNNELDKWARKYKMPKCPGNIQSYEGYRSKILKPEVERRIANGYQPDNDADTKS